MKPAFAMLVMLVALPASAAWAGERCDVPPQRRQSFEALGRLAGDFGWSIDRMKIGNGCYELRVTDASGNVLKVKINPATLEVVDGSVKRFGDESQGAAAQKTEAD